MPDQVQRCAVGGNPDEDVGQNADKPENRFDVEQRFVFEKTVIMSADIKENFRDQDPHPYFSKRQTFTVDIADERDEDQNVE